MSINYSFEQHNTQSQQQLQQFLAFSILIFQFELLFASQLVFTQISIAIILQLQCLFYSSSSSQSSNKLESESSKYQICYTIKIMKIF